MSDSPLPAPRGAPLSNSSESYDVNALPATGAASLSTTTTADLQAAMASQVEALPRARVPGAQPSADSFSQVQSMSYYAEPTNTPAPLATEAASSSTIHHSCTVAQRGHVVQRLRCVVWF